METPFDRGDPGGGVGHPHEVAQSQGAASRGRPHLVEHVLRTALALAPPERIFVVVGHQAREVQAAVEDAAAFGFISRTSKKARATR